MRVSAEIQVKNILEALDLKEVPEGCDLEATSSVIVEGCEVDDDQAIDALDLEDDNPTIDADVLQELSSAIRRGDRVDAEHFLDRIFSESSSLTERIQRGRYSCKARNAIAA